MTDPSSGPSDVPGPAPGSGAVSERMRELLSRAADEQLQEQRAVSSVLQDLRSQVAALGEALSRTASGAGVERVAAGLAVLAGDLGTTTTSLVGRLDGLDRLVEVLPSLRDEVHELAGRVAAPTTPAEVADAVVVRLAAELVDDLGPRVADVVASRVAPPLVEQVSAAVGARVLAELSEVVRRSAAESERRVLAHVDEAVLVLADALLRRRRPEQADGDVVATGVAVGPREARAPEAHEVRSTVEPAAAPDAAQPVGARPAGDEEAAAPPRPAALGRAPDDFGMPEILPAQAEPAPHRLPEALAQPLPEQDAGTPDDQDDDAPRRPWWRPEG